MLLLLQDLLVRVHLPLQQGLRPESLAFTAFGSCTSASSITTRIKTRSAFIKLFIISGVRVHLPLQQGLRHFLRNDFFCFSSSTSASSITTRIKTVCPRLPYLFQTAVRVHLPLQQGLRLTNSYCGSCETAVRVHLPLQQGLRLNYIFPIWANNLPVRVHLPLQQGLRPLAPCAALLITSRWYECIFHYNKD